MTAGRVHVVALGKGSRKEISFPRQAEFRARLQTFGFARRRCKCLSHRRPARSDFNVAVPAAPPR